MTTAIQHSVGPYTVEKWLALSPPVDGSRLELIFGHLHVSPAPAGEHQFAAFRLCRLVEDAIRARSDLYVVPAVNLKISTPWRTGLIPDVVVLTTPPVGNAFPAEVVSLVVELWSPGNKQWERDTKKVAYAAAGIPWLWTVERDRFCVPTLTAYQLEDGQYTEKAVIHSGESVTLNAAPVPIPINMNDLAV